MPQIKKNRKPNTGHDRKLNLRDCHAQRISKDIPDISHNNKSILVSARHTTAAAAAAAASLHSCPTLCDPRDGSPPGSPIPEVLQARTLEWVAISFSNAWKGKVKVKSLSRVRLVATPWTAAHQAPPSMGFARQEYWSGVPLPSPVTPLLLYKYLKMSACFTWQ